ncbi:hypothetical protein VTH06DRAFT_1970 [Thermothelomyces fergusii]
MFMIAGALVFGQVVAIPLLHQIGTHGGLFACIRRRWIEKAVRRSVPGLLGRMSGEDVMTIAGNGACSQLYYPLILVWPSSGLYRDQDGGRGGGTWLVGKMTDVYISRSAGERSGECLGMVVSVKE